MSSSKHPLSGHGAQPLPADDLKQNPMIGQSKGTTAAGEDPSLIAGENTVEGDRENDTGVAGQLGPGQLGRANR
jgi:hypothetical protein